MQKPKEPKDPQPVRNDLEEKAPGKQRGDKFAGLQPDAQDDKKKPIRQEL